MANCRHSHCRLLRRSSSSYLPHPEFWNDLPKIWFSKIALRELRRQLEAAHDYSEHPPRPLEASTDIVSRLTRSSLKELKRFARAGGLDTTDIRDYPLPLKSNDRSINPPTHAEADGNSESLTYSYTYMHASTEGLRSGSCSTISVISSTSQKTSVRAPSSSSGSDQSKRSERDILHTKTDRHRNRDAKLLRIEDNRKNSSAYDRNFEAKLIADGIYLADAANRDGELPAPPKNSKEIKEQLASRRPSLAESELETLFKQFRTERTRVSCGQDVISNILPLIEGPDPAKSDPTDQCHGALVFDNFKPFIDQGLLKLNPDRVHASSAQTLKRKICEDLKDTIRPSKRTRSTICPNFTLEIKGPDGSGQVAETQACYNAAFGARAMHALRAYSKRDADAGAVYDGNAYTLSSTFEPHPGTLTLYATYPRKASRHGGTEYIMTTIDSWSMKGNMESWERAITAYRNARDWAREKREEAIREANERVSAAASQKGGSSTRITRSTKTSHATETAEGEANPIVPDPMRH